MLCFLFSSGKGQTEVIGEFDKVPLWPMSALPGE